MNVGRRVGSVLLWAFLGWLPPSAASAQPNLGFDVPPGFEVTLFADDALATDIFHLTFDAKGRVAVAGRNYVKILEDVDGDGKADRAILYSELPKSGAHGMVFDGPDLIVVGDEGVRRLIDRNGDGKADDVSPVWIRTRNDGEHAANALVRGPDGWFWLITGNDAGIGPEHAASKRSPIRDPNSGTVLRLAPEGKSCEIVAEGLRNPYGMAFGHLGQLFTVDSDGERIYRLPFYAPTRLFDLAYGQHHGWLQKGWVRSWSRPPWFPDAVERLVEIGRGSPTGVHVYRHRAFPPRYRNGVFSLCWTFGRIYFFPMERDGSTFSGKAEVFVKTAGDVGFAPTAMAVGPDGALYVAIGGRGTRGSVFRIAHKGPLAELPADPVRAILAADEPASAWSRTRWVPAARKLGPDVFAKAVLDAGLPIVERVRAVEILTDLFGGVPLETARKIAANEKEPEVATRAIWSLTSFEPSPEAWKLVGAATGAKDPRIARAAWEGTLRGVATEPIAPAWRAGLNHPDRRVRAAAVKFAAGPGRAAFDRARKEWTNPTPRERLAELRIDGVLGNESAVRTCIEVLGAVEDPSVRMDAVRLIQLAMNDVDLSDTPDRSLVGYAAADRGKIPQPVRQLAATSLANVFPAGVEPLDQEIARTLGMLAEPVPGIVAKVLGRCNPRNDPETDVHYLLTLARIPGSRSSDATRRTAEVLNGVYARYLTQGHKPADHAPAILESMFDHLLKHDPKLAAALSAEPTFGTPGQELFALRISGEAQRTAARKLLKSIEALEEDKASNAWSPDLVKLVALLPPAEGRPILRQHFRDARLADAIALELASQPDPDDRPRYVEALGSAQAKVVRAAAEALLELKGGGKAEPKETSAAIGALRRFVAKEDAQVRRSLDRLLAAWLGETPFAKDEANLHERWNERFGKLFPEEAKRLARLSGADLRQWKQRLDGIEWTKGNAAKGEVLFHRKNCYRCHVDSRRLGPDLAGAAQRFSIHDLFVAIVDPSRDVAPAYRGVSIVTTSGKIYSGILIYQSNELNLLQTSPDVTARIPGSETVRVQPAAVSFMPNGLLDGLEDADLADLLAYLKTLRR